MATPSYAQVISAINTFIITNGNNEITANVLNPILVLLTDFTNNTIGDLNSLTTDQKNTVVDAINSLKVNINNISNNGVQLYSGMPNPNVTPPPTYKPADFYLQVDSDSLPVQLWQYDGFSWISGLSPIWGNIVGTVTDQTDLVDLIDSKIATNDVGVLHKNNVSETKTGSLSVAQIIKLGTPASNLLLAGGGDIPQAAFELVANKQNNLNNDGTGTKYPTIDLLNNSLVKVDKINFKDIYQTGILRIDLDVSVVSVSPANTLNITACNNILFVNEIAPDTPTNQLADYLKSFGNKSFVANATNTPLTAGTRGIFYVGLDKLGTPVYRTSKVFDQDVCYYARIVVENNAGVYTIVLNKYIPDLANNRINNHDRFVISSGYIVPSGAASISFGNRGMSFYRNSINYAINKFDPNYLQITDSVNPTPMSFLFYLPNITSLAVNLTPITVLNPSQWYTSAGVVGGSPVAAGNYQVYKLYLSITGTIVIQTKASTSNAPALGVNAIFGNRDDALAGLTSTVFPPLNPVGDYIALGTFFLRAGTAPNGSQLNDPNDFYFQAFTSTASSSTVGVTSHDLLSGKNDNPTFLHVTSAEKTDWNNAFADRLKWDGGATGLVAATGRSSLGGTTLGQNIFTSPNVITSDKFLRANFSDNSVSWLDAVNFRTAIGAGTGNGSVTSVNMTVPTGLSIAGNPITTSGTLALSLTAGYSIPTTIKQGEWDLAYTNRITSLTTTGSSGAATLSANVLNVPNYTLAGLGGINLSTILSGFVTGANTTVLNTDSLEVALEKLQGQINARTSNTGTVTSVAMTTPTGLTIGGSPITTAGTLALTFTAGYSIPTDAKQTNWDTAFTNRITSLTTTGSSGASTLSANVLNVPNYTLAGLGGINFASVISGFATGANSTVLNTDSLEVAIEKLQGQINARTSGIAGTNNTVAKFTGAGTIGNSNITDTGSLITLGGVGVATAGNIGIKTASYSNAITIYMPSDITGGVDAYGIYQLPTIKSDVTASAVINRTFAGTQAASFTLNRLSHFEASQGTFGAGSSVTNQYGFYAYPSLIGANNNYGFRGDIPAGIGNWNLYMGGTAQNYFAGNLGIGIITPTKKLEVIGDSRFTKDIVVEYPAGGGVFAGTTNNYLSKSAGNAPDFNSTVILLHPVYVGVNITHYECKGRISVRRGSSSASLRDTSINIETATSLNENHYFSEMQGGNTNAYSLVTCDYLGVKYVALKFDASVDASARNFGFDGYIQGDDNALLAVNYFNTSTSTVLNAEVNGSIASISYNLTKIINSSTTIINSPTTVIPAGNVGIGTGSPQAKLDIFARTNGSGIALKVDTNTRATGEDYIWFGDAVTPDFLVNTTGNVGIGTATPSATNKLEVVGNVQATTFNGVKKYIVQLTQTGTSAPTIVATLVNNVASVTITRLGAGDFRLTSTDFANGSKMNIRLNPGISLVEGSVRARKGSGNTIELQTYNTNPLPTDGILSIQYCTLDVEVYP